MNSSKSSSHSLIVEGEKQRFSTFKLKRNHKIDALRDEKEPHCPLSQEKLVKKDENFDYDEQEQRIMDFLESNGIYTKLPIEKYYDYYEKRRLSIGSVNASCFSPHEERKEGSQTGKEELTFTLCSDLYQKRKSIIPIQKKNL